MPPPDARVDVEFVASPEPGPGASEIVDGAGCVAGLEQELRENGRLRREGRAPAVGHDAVGDGELAGVKGRERGVRWDGRAEEPLAQSPRGGEVIDGWTRRFRPVLPSQLSRIQKEASLPCGFPP